MEPLINQAYFLQILFKAIFIYSIIFFLDFPFYKK